MRPCRGHHRLGSRRGTRYNDSVMVEAVSWLDTIGRIFDAIPDLATPAQVQRSLREILEDPALRVYWWDWERDCYVGIDGSPEAPQPHPGAVTTPIEYETRRIGLLVHDPRLLESPEFTASFVPLMRIAMERDRLHRDLVAKLEQLQASRLRIVRASDTERRRLERNLHDGAQQRLTTALLTLRSLEAEVAGDRSLTALVERALDELQSAIEDLREIARGLHPPLLAREGLEAALRAGASRATVPVELDVRIPGRLPPPVEAAAYYVVAEAVTNTVKHARASRVWLSAVQESRALAVVVRDDGIGGACVECGTQEATGLGGLQDRVEALGGTLDVVSPDGEGTCLTAIFPLDAELQESAADGTHPGGDVPSLA
jgi:signal transduction histidine kinase